MSWFYFRRVETEYFGAMHPVATLTWAVIAAALPLLILLIIRGPVDGEGDTNEGYWGTKTANTNWCEEDYVFTPYVAEFGSSLSSLAIVCNGLYGLFMHWSSVETRYLFAYLVFVVVGLGSSLFHATLRREYQLLDELPMMWGNGIFIYIVECMSDKIGQPRVGLTACIVAAEAIGTVAVVLFDDKDQTIFLICYGSGVAYLMISGWALNNKFNPSKDVVLLETSILFYVGGLLLWLIDRHYCHEVVAGIHIRSMYLHCFWHFGAGIGTFLSVLFWIFTRNAFLKRGQILRGCTPADYWIELLEDGQAAKLTQ